MADTPNNSSCDQVKPGTQKTEEHPGLNLVELNRQADSPACKDAPGQAGQPPEDPGKQEHDMQNMPGMNHDMHNMHDMQGMENMPGMDHGGMHHMETIAGGPYKNMGAIGSGTSLNPSSSPENSFGTMKGQWMLMVHGDAKLGIDSQGGPRGVTKENSPNWLMVMGQHPAAGGEITVRGMFSAEPFTAPGGGYPLLFQTGETYKGKP